MKKLSATIFGAKSDGSSPEEMLGCFFSIQSIHFLEYRFGVLPLRNLPETKIVPNDMIFFFPPQIRMICICGQDKFHSRDDYKVIHCLSR